MTADTVTIFIDLADLGDFTPNPDVGTIYEVAINGDGLMLAEDPDQGIVYSRGQVPLFPERLATTDTPFSQAINRYTFYSLSQFDGGEGETFMSRPDTDTKKYRRGSAINPFDDGVLSLGPSAASEHDTAFAGARMTVVGSTLYVVAAADELDYCTAGGGWNTLASITDTTGAVTITGLTSDGNRWYAATGRSIIRGTTTDPGADWSTVDAVDVVWAAGRIMAAVKGGSSTTPNILMPINDSGTDESSGGLIIFPEEQEILLGGVAQGVFFFGVKAGTDSAIYGWRLGLQEGGAYFTPVEAFPLPDGADLVSVDARAGSVWFTVVEIDGTMVLYRGVPSNQDGLQVVRVAELEGHGSQAFSSVVEYDNKVVIPWATQLGAVGLESGGFARWTDALAEEVNGVAVWDGTVVAVDTTGEVWRFDDGFAEAGYVTSPVMDGASTLDKIWDSVSVVCEPISANEAIQIQYSVDGGESWNTVGTVSSAGVARREFDIGIQSPTLALRANLTGPGTTTPSLISLSAQVHPLGITDRMVVLPVRCADTVRGLEGQIIDGTGRGYGARLARRLEGYAGQRVQFQDIDWPEVGLTEVYEVMQAETSSMWVQNNGSPQLTSVVTLTMRKAADIAESAGG